ncbi:MAG: hypothetical protein JJLCMIEE_03090 [Acidimicrobiales bacterium]|nr:MAG: hypothetical protein EDR02_08080 [Actinomycetota bacterium]MBV6509972.1 hypothetical protein [Acidimicrobiales bacterium]RIK08539.1 MAG: hypothetical protein DCC48_00925 [Acidobacteriota bacterium]
MSNEAEFQPFDLLSCLGAGVDAFPTHSLFSMEIGPSGPLARISAISEDGRRLFLEFRNGTSGSADGSEPFEFEVGDVVVMVTEDGDTSFVEMPPSCWPDEPWIGVVRLKLNDITLIESGGRLRRVPTSGEVDYEESNTVEAGDHSGVQRVLSPEPIRAMDFPGVADIGGRFLVSDDSNLTFDDFGGAQPVVARARELIELPLQVRRAPIRNRSPADQRRALYWSSWYREDDAGARHRE